MVKEKIMHVGAHFSAHVHGMFLHPKATIRRVVREPIEYRDLWVPLLTILVASVMSSIGAHLWFIALEGSIFMAFLRAIGLIVDLFLRPFWYIFVVWLPLAFIFHFLGSIVSGKDIMDFVTFHKSLKLIGISMVPAFLNILPYFSIFTGYWIYMLFFWSMRENYGTHDKGAFIITLPYLFVLILGTLHRFGLL